MFVGCYSLHLYCEGDSQRCREFGEFTGETRAQAITAARGAGWSVHPDRKENSGYRVRCPKHRRHVNS